jgi:hypothetical protein
MTKLNEEKLAEELDMEVLEAEVSDIQDSFRINTSIENSTPDQILKNNIERANRVLDILEDDALERKVISARKAEVMAQLINAVTNAANSIISDEYNKDYLQLRRSVLQLKEKEMRIKEIGTGDGNVSERILVTDRETIMQLLRDGKDKGEIPDVKQLEQGDK